jgi:hypothetical protein
VGGSFIDYQVLYTDALPTTPIRLGQLLVDESEVAPFDMLKYCSSLSPVTYTSFSDSVVALIPVGANPTASVGLTAVNGSAVTFMRSDAAPPLSQAITPTWTGVHTFSNDAVFNDVTTFTALATFTSIPLIDVAGVTGLDWQGTRILLNFFEDDQAADEGKWRLDINTKVLTLETNNDAGSAQRTAFSVSRGTGIALTTINVGNSTDLPTINLRGVQTLIEPNTTIGSPDLAFRTDANTGLYRVAADDFALVAGGASRFQVNATGVGFNAATPIARPNYTITNPTTNRSLDVAAAAIGTVRQVLGTVIQDLIDYGLSQ